MYTNHTSSSNHLQIANADLPSWLYASGATNSFIVGFWMRRNSGAGVGFRNVFFFQNLFQIVTSGSVGTVARFVALTDTTTTNYTAGITGGGAPNEKWLYVLAGWDKGTNECWICLTANDGQAYVKGAFTHSTHTPGVMKVGATFATPADGGSSGVSSHQGEIGPIVIKNFQLSTEATIKAICQSIYDSKDIAGLFSYSGNGLGGESDSEWMAVNFSIPQSVGTSIVAGATQPARYGDNIVGGASTNYVWMRKGAAVSSSGSLIEARPITVNGTLVYLDHEQVVSNFFVRKPPGLTTPGVNSVNSPIGKRLADDTPSGIEKILVWSNSRGMRNTFRGGSALPALWYNFEQNHAQGYTVARLSNAAGVLNSPPATTSVPFRRFGTDQPNGARSTSTESLRTYSSATYNDFLRAWTNAGVTNQGPGLGVALHTNGAVYSQRLRKYAGSKLDGVQGTGWRHQIHMMKFPGSCNSFDVGSCESSTSNANVSVTPINSVSGFDTTLHTATFADLTDTYNAGTKTLVLGVTALTGIVPGDLCFVSSGTGVGSLAEVESINVNGDSTVVFRHAFQTAIADGSVLKFGPKEFVTIDHTLALPTLEFQGLHLTHTGTTGHLLCVYATSGWAEGVDGWVFGPAGWGGNGFSNQYNGGFSTMFEDVARAVGANAVMLHHATQGATPANRSTAAGFFVDAGIPAQNILLMSDQQHHPLSATHENWVNDSLAQSVYPAVNGSESLLVGDFYNQLANNAASDGSHPSVEGMRDLALGNLEAMDAFEPGGAGGGSKTILFSGAPIY